MRNITDQLATNLRRYADGVYGILPLACMIMFATMLTNTSYGQAEIRAAKNVVSVSPAASGITDNVDITFQIVVKNTGTSPLESITLTDDLSDDAHLGGAHVGIAEEGLPTIVSATFPMTPTLNADYTGSGGETNIFTGMDGTMNPGDSIIVQFTSEVNPSLADDASMLFNQAMAVGTNEGATVDDLSDNDTISVTNINDLTPVLPCFSNCEIQAKEQINVSVDPITCEAEVTASMAGVNVKPYCNAYYTVTLYDVDGNELPDAMVDASYIGQNMTMKITEPECGNVSWGMALIEDKVAPVLTCEDVTLSCAGYGDIPPPTVEDLCANSDYILIDEVHENLDCDPDYIGTITRTYIAEDSSGNQSAPCTQTVYLERVMIGTIFPPAPMLFPINNLVCGDNFQLDENGNPHPNVTGVPTTITGAALYPMNNEIYCNGFSDYEDQVISVDGCITKIMRTFTIGEWHCNSTNTVPIVQMIDIVDENAPNMVAPADITVSTATFSCSASVVLPAVTVSDDCNEPIDVDVEYPGGFLDNQNGGLVVLPVGEHLIKYTAYDECLNSADAFMNVTVVDQSDPIAICDNHDVVAIGIDGYGAVTATGIDDGSFDECGEVSLAIAILNEPGFADGSAFREKIEFGCDDIGTTVMVALRVTDQGGNSNMCMVSVDIQDKVDAFISCPPNVVIDCETPYDLEDLSEFGVPTLTDNCNNTEWDEEVTTDLNTCGQGTITRHFTVLDNAARSCTQTITIVNNAAPFTENDIDWPENYTAPNACTEVNHTPEFLTNIHPDFGFPVIDDNTTCRQTAMDYTDEEFVGGGGACRTIYRKWVVIDWCSQLSTGGFATYEHTQIITLDNATAPEITSSEDAIMVESYAADCGSVPVQDLVVTANDDCTPDANLLYSYSIDLDNDGIFDMNNIQGADASGLYPLGSHRVLFTVRDGCGNEAYSERAFSIVNLKTPTPYCFDTLYVDLTPMDLDNDGTPDAEMAVLPVSTFDAGTYHDCGYDFTLSFSEDVNDTELTVDCDDVGFVEVQLWATDENGNADYCVTWLGVQDNNGINVCNSSPQMATVSGTIYTESLEEVSDARVGLNSADVIFEMTSELGEYAFEDRAVGYEYEVRPYKNDDVTNGVSTLDVVLIQRHILGLSSLETPYQLIAADINNNESISASDVVALRKVVLGIADKFPNDNTSWRFVDAQYEFLDNEDPWYGNIAEEYEIASLNEDMSIDFIGVKVGDVNGSVAANANSVSTEERSSQKWNINILDREVKIGELLEIEVKSGDVTELLGWQQSWSLQNMNYVGIVPAAMEISDRNINVLNDRVNISYTKADGISCAENELLYVLTLQARKAGKLSELLSIADRGIKAEAYNTQLDIQSINIRWEESEIAQVENTFELLQNEPNPWKEMTNIAFSIPQAGQVKIVVKDISGKTLLSRSSHREAGKHNFTLTNDMLRYSGVLLYEIHFADQVKTNKMILMD